MIDARTPLAALALLVLASAPLACGPGPFSRAASAYATANQKSTEALSRAPSTALSVCRKKARIGYLQVRLGIMAAPEPIGWNDWYEEAKATETQTWKQYCQSMSDTGKVFNVAVGSLRQYGSALGALSDGGKYDGSDIKKSAEGAEKIATALDETGAAAAMKPVGKLLGAFAGFLFQDETEDHIEAYVRRADPLMQPLIAGLGRYFEALDDELRLAESSQRQTLRALEVRGGLEDPLADPAMLIAFYDFAVATDSDIERTRAVLEGYKEVLSRLGKAHAQMVATAEKGNPIELKKTIGTIFDLLTQLEALNVALTKE